MLPSLFHLSWYSCLDLILFSKSMSSLHFVFSMSPRRKTHKPMFNLSLAQGECTSHRFVGLFWLFGVFLNLHLPFLVGSSLLLVAWVTVWTPYLAFKANHRWVKVALHKLSIFCHLLGSLVSNLHVTVWLLCIGVYNHHDTSKYRNKY